MGLFRELSAQSFLPTAALLPFYSQIISRSRFEGAVEMILIQVSNQLSKWGARVLVVVKTEGLDEEKYMEARGR